MFSTSPPRQCSTDATIGRDNVQKQRCEPRDSHHGVVCVYVQCICLRADECASNGICVERVRALTAFLLDTHSHSDVNHTAALHNCCSFVQTIPLMRARPVSSLPLPRERDDLLSAHWLYNVDHTCMRMCLHPFLAMHACNTRAYEGACHHFNLEDRSQATR